MPAELSLEERKVLALETIALELQAICRRLGGIHEEQETEKEE